MKTVNQENRATRANKKDAFKRKRAELRQVKVLRQRLQGAIL